MKARWLGPVVLGLIVLGVVLLWRKEAGVETPVARAPTAGPAAPGAPAETPKTAPSDTGATGERADAALARKSTCFECHDLEKPGVGPSVREIAARYQGDVRARATLIATVKQGGKGNWTEVSHGAPMPPFERRLSAAEVERLVDWMLRPQGGGS